MDFTRDLNRDFKMLYGELLFPHGFTFNKRGFYRRHGDDVLLEVSVFRRHPYFEVTFETYPFSCAYTAERGWRGWGVDWFMANLCKKKGLIYKRQPQDSYEEKMERMYQAFSSTIFPEFNQVVSLDTERAYTEWLEASVGLPRDLVSGIRVFLQQKDYLNARKRIDEYFSKNALSYSEKAASGNRSAFVKEYAFWLDIADGIDQGCYCKIDDYIQEQINITRDTCKRLWIVSQ